MIGQKWRLSTLQTEVKPVKVVHISDETPFQFFLDIKQQKHTFTASRKKTDVTDHVSVANLTWVRFNSAN